MVRKTSLALMIAAFLAPLGAYALGLGDIHLKSALDQELSADIDLLSVRMGELDTVKAELAPLDAYERAGIDRSFLLTQLRFNPVRRPDGTAVIQITTREPIREPFLNFLIEVNWPQGRLLREYTVLLDPPATMNRRPPAVATPAIKAPAGKPQVSQGVEEPAYATAAPGTEAAGEYGPVKANETLWDIADELRPSGVTIERMMIALQQANPSAFYKSNINYLKRGAILRVPDAEELETLSAGTAHAAFLEQTARWASEQGVGQPGAAQQATAPVTPGPRPTGQPSPDELRILAAPSEKTAGTQEGGAAAQAAKLQNELLFAREANDSARQQSKELQSRVADLESQLADLQKLLTLKDDQLAALQATLASTEEQSDTGLPEPASEAMPEPLAEVSQPEAIPTEASPEPGESAVAAPMVEPTPPAEPGEVPQPEQVPEVAMAEGATPEEGATAPETEMASEGMPETMPSEAAPMATEPAPMPTPPESAVSEPAPSVVEAESAPAPRSRAESGGLVQSLLKGSGLYWIIGGVVVVVAGGIGAVMTQRRRKPAEEQPEESILVDLQEEPGDTPSALATSGEADSQTDETSFLSDFSPSDIDALQDETGEVDPISEADVYMAYNRYQQAEELLRQGIRKEPDRSDLRFKLLEVLFAAQSVDAFVDEAEKLAADGAANDYPQDWARVVSMGQDASPDNPLFAEGAASIREQLPSGDETAVIAGYEHKDELRDIDLGDVESELEAATSGLSAEQAPSEEDENVSEVDFGDSVFEFVNEAPEPAPASEREDTEQPMAAAEESDELAVGDLEFESSSDFIAESSPGLEELQAEEVDLDFSDLSDLDSSLGEEEGLGELDLGTGLETGAATDDLGGSLADEGLDFDRMESIPGEDSVSVERLDAGIGELGVSDDLALEEETSDEGAKAPGVGMDETPSDEDEVATKLDLARAYIDMGDEDGARSILDEVMAEGNESQQTEAKELMQQMA